jgi:multidrug transporter EmrE-like cation transporter
MFSWIELASLVLVGAFWGCTNPLLRQGSSNVQEATTGKTDAADDKKQSMIRSLTEQLVKFRYVSVWLPYAMNQLGSLLFYVTLSQSDLSLAVPACNALALVFSIVTSWWVLKEPMDRPLQTICGAALVMIGVALCVNAGPSVNENSPPASDL